MKSLGDVMADTALELVAAQSITERQATNISAFAIILAGTHGFDDSNGLKTAASVCMSILGETTAHDIGLTEARFLSLCIAYYQLFLHNLAEAKQDAIANFLRTVPAANSTPT